MRRISLRAEALSRNSAGARGLARMSSTSSEACQKNKYGLIVVPNTPTTTAAAPESSVNFGHTVRKALARDPSDLRAHGLDRGHQRIGQRHGPEHVEAKLRPRLRVGGNTAWVVVGHAGDQSGTEPRQRMLPEAAP